MSDTLRDLARRCPFRRRTMRAIRSVNKQIGACFKNVDLEQNGKIMHTMGTRTKRYEHSDSEWVRIRDLPPQEAAMKKGRPAIIDHSKCMVDIKGSNAASGEGVCREIGAHIVSQGAVYTIPPKENAKEPLYKHAYKKLNGFRRIFTRSEKRDDPFHVFVCIACVMILPKWNKSSEF